MKQRSTSGFTIVELLIVIVIIGILAGITIVSYSGITGRAKLAAAKTTAATVSKKIQLYNVEVGSYPLTSSALTGSSAKSTSYYITGIPFSGTIPSSAPADTNTMTLQKCDATDGSTGGLGNKIIYWDSSANATATVLVGDTTACTTVS